ncbi:hypothetical protein EMEDMD4_380012 [Sinorhizobium medicae]|uniref:Uncharacterized protein n=1 Tax=Sinorhizobium medicae TaxID=110321 RepID=A0A508WXP4_9HYPH|nr:hypothetical protein EMEDMD4_380012 [Sinorhizobium medicae]
MKLRCRAANFVVSLRAQAPLRGSSMPVDKYDGERRHAQGPKRLESHKAGQSGHQTEVIYG